MGHRIEKKVFDGDSLSCFSTDFSYSSLQNCKFHNSDLIRSIFWKADLRGADFSAGSGKEPADLSDADLREIKYDETTNFSGAYYSARTYFPKSFRPQEHNMQLMESSIDSQWKQFWCRCDQWKIQMISDVKAGIGNHFMARIGNNTQFKILNSSIIRYNLENFHDIIRVALAFFTVLRYNCK